MKPDLKINFAGVEFSNPVLVASGTFNYGLEMARFYPLSQLGGIVTKSITLKSRPGHPYPRTYETKGGMLNAIGLANPGIEKFLSKKMPFLRTVGTRLVVNIAGSTIEEFVELAQWLSDVEGIDGIEVNISCPNVKEGGLEFSATPQPTFRVLSAVRKGTRLPLVAKLSPNTADIGAIAQAAEEAG
ncbi:MAG: dihydroorotate dehydrogenase, partial [Limisphaerales bacterium]